MWSEFVASFSPDYNGGSVCHVTLMNKKKNRTFKPDLLLVRSEIRGVLPEQDFRDTIFALMYSNVPSVNSLHSIYCFLERPVVQVELNRLAAELGPDVFPLVHQSFFSSHREFMYGDIFPAVVVGDFFLFSLLLLLSLPLSPSLTLDTNIYSPKMGHIYGKIKIEDHKQMADFRSVLAVTGQYCTAEPFLHGSYDLRIQYIRGSRVRVFKRESISGDWRTNTGSAHMTEVPTEEVFSVHVAWAEHASTFFGGLDICTVDALHDSKTGKDVIIEVNGSSSGFSPFGVEEDMAAVRSLVVDRMNDTIPI